MASEILEKAATVDDVVREVSKIKSMVADAVDDGVRSALRAARRGRKAAEDIYGDAVDTAFDGAKDALNRTRKVVKQNPLESVGIALAAIVITGGVVAWLTSRRR